MALSRGIAPCRSRVQYSKEMPTKPRSAECRVAGQGQRLPRQEIDLQTEAGGEPDIGIDRRLYVQRTGEIPIRVDVSLPLVVTIGQDQFTGRGMGDGALKNGGAWRGSRGLSRFSSGPERIPLHPDTAQGRRQERQKDQSQEAVDPAGFRSHFRALPSPDEALGPDPSPVHRGRPFYTHTSL
jgi:hypothetical protein